MHTRSLLLTALAPALLLSTAAAQELSLDLVAGSLPGTIAADLYTGPSPFYPCVFALGPDTANPLPLSLVDPSETRFLDVGLSMYDSWIWGTFAMDSHCHLGPFTFTGSPALYDIRIVVQGVSFFGPSGGFFDGLSRPTAFCFAPADTCRDRNVTNYTPRAFAATLPRADGKWMLVGGASGGLLSQTAVMTTEVFDAVTDTFSYGPNLSTWRSMFTTTLLPNGTWLLCGGVDFANDPQPDCEIYDPATDTFTPVASMLSPRMGHTATLLNDGRVLVTGGLHAMTVTPSPLNAIYDTVASTEIYDPATDTWSWGPNLSTPRAAHVAILRPDGKVLLAGGISWYTLIIQIPTIRSSTDLFDPMLNTMTAGPSMATARSLTVATDIGNDRWLVAGGISALTLTNQGTPTNAAEIYDAVNNTWSSAGSMATSRGNHGVVALSGNRWLHLGGANGSILSPTPLSSGEIYDAITNTWSPGASLNVPRAGFSIFETPTGQAQFFGGGSSNNTITTLTEWYYR